MEDRYLTPEEIKKYLKCGEYGGKGIFGPEETAFGIYCYAVAEISCNMPRERNSKFTKSIYDMSKYYKLPDEDMAILTGRVEMAQDMLDSIAKTYINVGKKTVNYDSAEFAENFKETKYFSMIKGLMPAVVYYNSLKMGLQPTRELPIGMFGQIDDLKDDLKTNFSYITNSQFIKSIDNKLTKEK